MLVKLRGSTRSMRSVQRRKTATKWIVVATFMAALFGVGPPAIAGDKVEICHFPPGNPSVSRTITIDEKAAHAHLMNGDLLGPCCAPPGCVGETPVETVYVANKLSNNVTAIDAQSNTAITTLPVQRTPLRVVVSRDGAFAYVPNFNSKSVSVVRVSDNALIDTVQVQAGPHHLAVTSAGDFVYVYNINASTVSVVRTFDRTVIETIPVGKGDAVATYSNIAITPDDRFIYVANTLDNTVSVIQTSDNTVIETIPVAAAPLSIASAPDGEHVYVVSATGHRVAVIQTSDQTVVKTISLPDVIPQTLAVTPDGAFVYVVGNSQFVEVIQTSDNSLIGQVELQRANFATDVVSSPFSDFIYVAANQTFLAFGTLNVIDVASNTVIKQIDIGSMPQKLAINASGSRVYVSDGSTVDVIQTSDNTLLATVPTGGQDAQGIAVTPSP
jgi:YVTN family beta-propeller protein